ncbi:MAG: immune inhibitor A, partial [Acidimicrobiales bacterium]|nr:immune inhibitor A [Acidimicrobiales bacterium]
MRRRSTGWATIGIAAALLTGAVGAPGAGARSASASGPEAGAFTRGARGAGDPYFPADGNGGYDVGHYGLELVYDPDNDVLEGVATIDARSTQGLSRFNLDFDGMTVDSVTVDGQPAAFARNRGELKVTPPAGIPVRTNFQVVVAYHGVPDPLPPEEGGGGWIPTEDGVVVVGQPHVASTWFPANDHPKDRATFDVAVTVPEGLEAVSNGRLVSHDTAAGETRWVWAADAPMAPYLATLDVGELELAQYHDAGARPGGVEWLDAVDPALRAGFAPRTGAQLAFSQAAQQTFKRLRRTVAVPPEGATLTFWVQRDTETDWDHFFVEARHLGQADWTTLPDANGHTTTGTGASCPYWLDLHPALRRYQTDLGDGTCAPTGTTGGWNAVSGFSDGWEQWSVDLGAYAGSTAQVALTYVSDDSIQGPGVAVDDVEVSTGEGSTSFEDDGDPLDGWTVPGAPQSSEANTNDWTVITEAGAPPSYGEGAQQSLGRGPEILAFLADRFGDYPFADAGGIVDDVRGLGFALENQTRPVYAPEFFGDPEEGDAVVVHELAHQWFG